MPLVEARLLAREHGRVTALAPLDFEVAEGEILGVIGPPGAGKTTLIDLLSTAVLPTRGSLRIGGFDAVTERTKIRRLVGCAPHALALHPDLTAIENLRLFGALYGRSGPQLRQRAEELLAQVGVDPGDRERVRALPTDRRRRINFAAALLHTPRLVLLDEPLAGCDPETSARLRDVTASLPSMGQSVILATRRLGLVDRLATRVMILVEGRLRALGTRRELAARLSHRAVLRLHTRDPLRAEVIDSLMGGRGYALEPHVLEMRAADADQASELLAETIGKLHRARLPLLAAEVREPDLQSIVFELTGSVLEQ